MEFRSRTIKEIADMICGNFKAEESFFRYRSSTYLTEFFQDCGTDHRHDGSTRNQWAAEVLRQILAESSPGANITPESFTRVIRMLMDSGDAVNEGPERSGALQEGPLERVGPNMAPLRPEFVPASRLTLGRAALSGIPQPRRRTAFRLREYLLCLNTWLKAEFSLVRQCRSSFRYSNSISSFAKTSAM
jgi:hypothetical protein